MRSLLALSTLADNAFLSIDNEYTGLLHKAFLFEYEASGFISAADSGDMLQGDGFAIVLAQQDLSGAEIDTILTGLQITDQDMNIEVPTRQQIFGVATIDWVAFDPFATLAGTFRWHLHFKPKSKGGIPFAEGSGWRLLLLNRTGSAFATGNQVNVPVIYERFAYEGGGGA